MNTFGLSLDEPYRISGDSFDYINSAETLLDEGEFTFFKTNEDDEFVSNFSDKSEYNKSIFYSFRSPGFAFFYLPIRLFFSQHYSLLLFLGLQIIISAIAKYSLSKLSEMLTDKKAVFVSVFIFLNITPYFVQYNNLILTESLGFSFLVFYLFYFVKAIKANPEDKKVLYKLYVISGVCLTIAVMLRPFLAVFLMGTAFYMLFRFCKNFKQLIIVGVLFFSSFAVVDGYWTVRNYIKSNKFIPLASTMEFQAHKHLGYSEMQKFAMQRHLSDRWFDVKSPVYWLVTQDDIRDISELVQSDKKSELAELNKLKLLFHNSLNPDIKLIERKALEKKVANDLKLINDVFYKENELLVNYISPFKAVSFLLKQPNLRFFHHVKYPFNLGLVLMQSTVLRMIFLIGVIASFLLFFLKGRKYLTFLFLPSSIFLVFFFGWLSQSVEFRELYTFSGMFVLSLAILLDLVFNKSKKLFIFSSIFILMISTYYGFNLMLEEIRW